MKIQKVNKSLLLFCVMSTVTIITPQIFAFLLNTTTSLIQKGMLIAGLALFFLYLFEDFALTKIREKKMLMQMNFKEETLFYCTKKAIDILKVVNGKVKKSSKKISKKELLLSLGEYFLKKKQYQLTLLQYLLTLFFSIFSLIGVILVAIKQVKTPVLLIGILVFSTLFNILFLIKRMNKKREENTYHEFKEKLKETQVAENEFLNVITINEKQQDFLIAKLLNCTKEKIELESRERRKDTKNKNSQAIVTTISLVALMVSFMLDIGIENTSDMFVTVISFSTLCTNLLELIRQQVEATYTVIDARKSYEAYIEDYTDIQEVYNRFKDVKEEEVQQEKLTILPFTYSYEVEDKGNFTLKSEKTLVFKKGKVTLLNGKSGAGKSTLLKIVSGEINLKGQDILKRKVCQYFDEATLGSNSLFEEITFSDYITESDEKRLVEILKGVQLYDELVKKAQGEKVISYLKNITVEKLSSGLAQRAMLARTLYNLDDADILELDEPIGNLDYNTAKAVMSFVIEYAKKDKKRIIILATHQYDKISDMIDYQYYFERSGKKESIIY